MTEMNEETLTAYHEAGHAVVALELGFPPQRLSIVPNDKNEGRLIAPWPEGFDEFSEDFEEVLRRRLVVLFAGVKSEELFTERPTDPDDPNLDPRSRDSDADLASDLVLRLMSETGDQDLEIASRAQDEAEAILQKKQAKVERLAKALVEHKELSGDDLVSIIEATRVTEN
jgi:ATP-dependent Zn protease